MPNVSVIIPFYGVEKYIEKCILSVKNQSFKDFECILVDDESPDNSYALAEKTIEGDNRFRIIRQKNKGLGGARNTGIENAQGKYICFLDSDDWWERDFLKTMYEQITNTAADIVVCRYKNITIDGKTESVSRQPKKGQYTDETFLLRTFFKYPSVWNKLFLLKNWKGIKFPEHQLYEDLATTYKLVFSSAKVLFMDDALYCYNLREGSIMRSFNIDKIRERFQVFKLLESEFLKSKCRKEILTQVYFSLLNITHLDLANANLKECEKILILNKLKVSLDKNYFNIGNILKFFKIDKKVSLFILAYYINSTLSLKLILNLQKRVI